LKTIGDYPGLDIPLRQGHVMGEVRVIAGAIRPYLDVRRPRELIRLLEEDGWRLARTRGSHRQYKNANKPGTVTVAGKPSLDVPPGTLNAILKQAGLKKAGSDE
jgi:predicted RNA binding protein YcfA (HicA-like mRNA interferase family)